MVKNMRKSIVFPFMLLLMLVSTFISINAQDEFEDLIKKGDVQFEQLMKKADEELEQMKKVDKEFAEILNRAWKELELSPGIVRDSTPKPVKIPVARPSEEPEKEPPEKPEMPRKPEVLGKPEVPKEIIKPTLPKPPVERKTPLTDLRGIIEIEIHRFSGVLITSLIRIN